MFLVIFYSLGRSVCNKKIFFQLVWFFDWSIHFIPFFQSLFSTPDNGLLEKLKTDAALTKRLPQIPSRDFAFSHKRIAWLAIEGYSWGYKNQKQQKMNTIHQKGWVQSADNCTRKYTGTHFQDKRKYLFTVFHQHHHYSPISDTLLSRFEEKKI